MIKPKANKVIFAVCLFSFLMVCFFSNSLSKCFCVANQMEANPSTNYFNANLLENSAEQTVLKTTTADNSPEVTAPDLSSGIVIPPGETGLKDSYLYYNLLDRYNKKYSANETYLNSVMFQNETELNLYNLTIASIKGLNYLDFRNVKSLNLSCNKITEISSTDLSSFTTIENLNLFDNEIESIDLTRNYTLKNVNLNNNKLSEISLKNLNNITVLLNFNRFSDIHSITLPDIIFNTNINIELINNNILNADDVVLDVDGIYKNKVNFVLGVQGVGFNVKSNASEEELQSYKKVDKTSPVKFYGFGAYDVKAVIKNRITGDTICEFANTPELPVESKNFNVGSYMLEYLNNSNNQSAYDPTNEIMGVFKPINRFDVVPARATAKIKVGGKLYDTYGKISGKAQLILSNPNDSGVLWYSVAGGEWKQGSVVELDHGGEYAVSYKVIDGDFESEINSTYIYSNLNIYVSDVFLIIIIIGIGLILFFIGLPLIKKYVIKR